MEVLITIKKDEAGEKYSLSGISKPFAAKAGISGTSQEAVIEEVRSFFPNDEITCLPDRMFN